MIEDKLSHAERLRLECLAQAVQHSQVPGSADAYEIVSRARIFESFVRDPEP